MNLFQTIMILSVMLITKDINKLKSIRENKKVRTARRIIISVMIFSLAIFLSINYFKTAIHLNEFHIIEKVHEEKGIYIYTILEDEKEKYLILKEGIFNKLFLECNVPIQEIHIGNIDTFKYKHSIDIENAIVTHTYQKRWGDGVLSFWLVLAVSIYFGSKQDRLSKTDKIIVGLWGMITVGVTVFFIL